MKRAAAPPEVWLRGGPPVHPFVYSKRLLRSGRGAGDGSLVLLKTREGRPCGWGLLHTRSTIAVRVLTYDPDEVPDGEWLARRVAQAEALRRDWLRLPEETDAWRVVHAEADGLSGLVVDRYAGVLSVEVLALGWYRRAVELKDALRSLLRPRAVVVRGDAVVERIEGFRVLGDAGESARTEIREHGVRYLVDPARGHKTGFFLDQRDHRRRLLERARGRRVLDLFCYTGGFSLAAAAGGAAAVRGVDLDEEAVAAARENAGRNGAPPALAFEHADAFDALRDAKPGAWDVVVCDPPKLAASRADLPGAMRKYEDMNALAFEKVARGGWVVSCSCSGLVSEGDFRAALGRAALRAGREVRVAEVGGAAPDHPWSLSHPQGRYLKVVWSVAV
jgi:23S rRNA (cytosine1962-C5)-methyltransferase